MSRRATICSSDMRPLSNSSPSTNTVGTASTLRASTSSWNRAPSMAVWRIRGLTMLIRLSAWTTSGQFWQVREKKVSKWRSRSMAATASSTAGSAVEGWPPTWRRASTNEVNSWPRGMPAKVTSTSVPVRRMANDGVRPLGAGPSARTEVTLGESPATWSSSSASSVDLGESSSQATSSMSSRSFSRWVASWAVRLVSSMAGSVASGSGGAWGRSGRPGWGESGREGVGGRETGCPRGRRREVRPLGQIVRSCRRGPARGRGCRHPPPTWPGRPRPGARGRRWRP